jgi:predicted nucleic acid-binding protein
MSGSVLVDTNILVYAYDRSDPEKQARALAVLDYLAISERGVLTAQVLSEFVTVTTRKLPLPLTIAQAYSAVQNLMHSWQVLDVTPLAALEAVRGVRDHQLHFWDALIWASARLAQINVVLSEDLPTANLRACVLSILSLPTLWKDVCRPFAILRDCGYNMAVFGQVAQLVRAPR